MTIDDLIAKAQAEGLTLMVDRDDIVVQAQTWDTLQAWTPVLKAHKPALVQRLTACPTCGKTAWRETPDEGRWCEPCVIAGRLSVVAVKIWSDKLEATLWVVADELPREQWPQDGTPVYTHREVQRLRHAGPNVLQWVHAAKGELGATVAEVKAPRQRKDSHEAA